jgi:hypothetical protein
VSRIERIIVIHSVAMAVVIIVAATVRYTASSQNWAIASGVIVYVGIWAGAVIWMVRKRRQAALPQAQVCDQVVDAVPGPAGDD